METEIKRIIDGSGLDLLLYHYVVVEYTWYRKEINLKIKLRKMGFCMPKMRKNANFIHLWEDVFRPQQRITKVTCLVLKSVGGLFW